MVDRLNHRFKHAGQNLAPIVAEASPLGALPPMEYVRRGNLFFSAEVEDALLPQVIELVGESQVVFGSDMPHGDRERFAARLLQQRTDINVSAKTSILERNPTRLYGLTDRDAPGIPHAV
jgi:predicted TIM-barrel fold metal-dependent hydrolase